MSSPARIRTCAEAKRCRLGLKPREYKAPVRSSSGGGGGLARYMLCYATRPAGMAAASECEPRPGTRVAEWQ